MKGGAQTALALGVGYILGRRRKMRITTALAIGAATGGLGGLAPAVLRRGVKLLGSTDIADAVGPQLGDIATTVRGELLDAGKAAAAAAVSSRIESLSDTLHDRAEALRNPKAADDRADEGDEDETAEPADERDDRDERDEDEADEADEADAESTNGQPARRTRKSRSPVTRTRR